MGLNLVCEFIFNVQLQLYIVRYDFNYFDNINYMITHSESKDILNNSILIELFSLRNKYMFKSLKNVYMYSDAYKTIHLSISNMF